MSKFSDYLDDIDIESACPEHGIQEWPNAFWVFVGAVVLAVSGGLWWWKR